jgi:hypothetical protein
MPIRRRRRSVGRGGEEEENRYPLRAIFTKDEEDRMRWIFDTDNTNYDDYVAARRAEWEAAAAAEANKL